jgi:hypothetical protein
MRCVQVLVFCALLPVSIPQSGRAQQSPSPVPAPAPVAAEGQPVDESPDVQINRLTSQLVELKKQQSALPDSLIAEYRARPESRQILLELDQARTALKAATDRVLTIVREDPQYRAELAVRQQSHDTLKKLRTAARPDPARMTQAATASHLAALRLAHMESDAQDLDPQVAAAKVRLATAEVAEADLQRRAQAYALTHRDYAKLMTDLWQAQVALDLANADLRVAAALTSPQERNVARAPVQSSASLGLHREWSDDPPMDVYVTPGPRLAQPLPIGSKMPLLPPTRGPSGIGRQSGWSD